MGTTRPYKNIFTMDSREFKVCGLIKDIVVSLVAHPNISLHMDIVVVDMLETW